MKVGRPCKRLETQKKILETLSSVKYPLTLLKIARASGLNWGTAKKYLNELISLEKVKAIELNTNKRKKIKLYVINR
ncbi:MAG: winged helix-turn-helix transcriptional regulator [Candidatus Aenigmarchaeota archaeon]|nr:winged helix-turn-helix transcriptional regulator [Candidatus Aenigmarchaeota archaeon]MDW8149424.1 winged helix-turn-helix transcriptional regulator [Candidatus Aenigmarchaeota archaeon]